MPIHASMKINDTTLSDVFISRLRSSANGVNYYSVIVEDASTDGTGEPQEPSLKAYKEEGVLFTHDESEGALTCLQRALEAWNSRVSSLSESR